MNIHWKTFLLAQQALVENENGIFSPVTGNMGQNSIYPLTHFAVLTVAGNDAALLLQGQITCNVNDISETQSSLAAMCNPKGRVIATFLLVKKADAFLLVLPVELLETVKNRLRMYVLRSDVKIIDSSDSYCLFGLCEAKPPTKSFLETEAEQDSIAVNFAAAISRKLMLADADTAINIWSKRVESNGFRQASASEWRYLDLIAGIPWLTTVTSEEFIPQMLNLDKLGGISFNKGCYTGQEIVARTHYLGKAKREMFLAECNALVVPKPNASIVYLESEQQEVVGKVLLAQKGQHNCKMLVVLQAHEPNLGILALKDYDYAELNLLPFNA